MDGIDILKKVKNDYPYVPVVIISGHGNIEIAVSAIKQGAYDFIEKPFNIEQLLVVVSAMETSSLRKENKELKQKDKLDFELIGESQPFRHLLSNLDKVSRANSRVFISGNSGSGKEAASRYIHENSRQSTGEFVSINCSTSNEDDLERLLFGYESRDGSNNIGALEKADGGTIFLDEVAQLPLELQGKLLKVLVENSIFRLGSNTKINVDIRVISSTSSNILKKMKNKEFREDLFHRLNVVPIKIPNLNDRIDDIPILSRHFVEKLSTENGLSFREFSDEALTFLQGMTWPGNIRQLRNLIERVLILGDSSKKISIDELTLSEINPQVNGDKISLISTELLICL